jgi:hypothetical protein
VQPFQGDSAPCQVSAAPRLPSQHQAQFTVRCLVYHEYPVTMTVRQCHLNDKRTDNWCWNASLDNVMRNLVA